MDDVRGTSDSRDDRFAVSIMEGNGPPRRRMLPLAELPPRIHQRCDGGTEWGAHRRGQLARFRPSAISEVHEGSEQRMTKL